MLTAIGSLPRGRVYRIEDALSSFCFLRKAIKPMIIITRAMIWKINPGQYWIQTMMAVSIRYNAMPASQAQL